MEYFEVGDIPWLGGDSANTGRKNEKRASAPVGGDLDAVLQTDGQVYHGLGKRKRLAISKLRLSFFTPEENKDTC